jgi:anthranilate phosphoribosyltransferase
LGVHTAFNLLGPLTNPARAPRQIIGVWKEELIESLAHTLALLGTEHAWVVHGADGLDEVTIADSTFVAEAKDGEINTFEIKPEDFGLSRAELHDLRGGDAEENAVIIRSVLSGDRRDAARSLVLINAAAALFVGGLADNLRSAMQLAAESIDTGRAAEKLSALVRLTNAGN